MARKKGDTRIEQAQYWARCMGYYSVSRPTEKAALKLWSTGYVNLRHYFGRYGYQYDNLPPMVRRTELEDDQPAPRNAYGQICNQCQSRLPLTPHWWHQDTKQRNGYKTICKRCHQVNRGNKGRVIE